MAVAPDRVGLGWRGELAAGILSSLAHIDVLEVIADDYYRASRAGIAALCSLARQVPLSLHGVGMGLASTIPADPRRLHAMARLMRQVQAESWSEHLSFVRAGGVEIGHLAAPPRTPHSAAGAIANIALATRIVGSAPLMENIATLVQPPASTMDEAAWLAQIVDGAQVPLLLDLHNLYANAVNFGEAPEELLLRLPLARVGAVHLSGGHWVAQPDGAGRRLLDDHLHDVPPAVFDLLTLLARHAPQPLTVIVERDGNYPSFAHVLDQLALARAALRAGRNA
ncbi:DUF692 domain-containing protein [Janthinobacterium sp. 1_2014MBL_MicDiv]|uniref:DUF692 domain-containing protein n=1 Tax=Janthinobacterium sp. 1_2014MBL_MicDiv TaxID=1644131 RepID=UPI0008F52CE0|nr:DUF692 family multinuclear iron-containing protein [Janthinobacterium sp. 1_2014MBL_MicDiv]APA68074.1 hypothetical protein YQ44_09770 [Janthinobacterium sp. 1_2014MBL_MicDiv]